MFFLGLWTSRLIAIPGALLLLLGLSASFRETRAQLWRSTPCKLALLWMLYITLSALVFAWLYPDYGYEMLNQGLRLVYLSGFVLIALGFSRHSDLIWPCLLLALLGFFLTRLAYLLWALWEGKNLLEGRPALGLHTPIAMGQYAFFALMALILFSSPLIGQKYRLPRLIAWLALFAFCCFLVFVSQSRSTWILVPLLLPSLVLALAVIKKLSWRRFLFIGSVTLLAGLILIRGYSDAISHRLQTESDTWTQIIAGDLEGVRASSETGQVKSIGVRVAMFRFGLEHWRKNPIFGLGPGASKRLLECCASRAFRQLNDFHSFIPEILVRTGVVGFTLLFLLNVAIVRAALRGYRAGHLPGELLLLVVFGLVLHWGVALGNFRMVNYDWRFYWFMLAGLASACSFGERDGISASPD